ncbi:hypothetical protein [Limnoglobus roseus]|uniref:Uncharacterized protein n=1 Tax=Limnoglobus roseus TaxID=2598579 RepID=A0A5C1AF27_9BACT|nr:hypothetical protein [Limnoglobus roseus]QEL17400.1 hypothetical protein PX52LOC_04388 [Limnoglobus roseus]
MMPEMTTASKRKLAAAVDTTCDLMEAGESIEEAAARAALEHGVPPAHLKPLCYAANTAAMEGQRQHNDAVMAKAAAVDVARPENVAEIMVRRTRTHKARKKEAAADPWQAPPTPDLSFVLCNVEAYAAPTAERPAEPVPRTKTAAALARRVTDESLAAVDRFRKTATDLIASLGDFHGPSLADLRRDGEVLFGPPATTVLNWVEPMVAPARRKEAARHASTRTRSYTLLKEAVAQYADLELLARAERSARALTAEAAVLDGPITREGDRTLAVMFGVKSASDLAKWVGINAMMERSKVEDPLKTPGDVESYRDQTDTMEHEAQLRNIRLAATLGGLMSHDEILRHAPPSEVTAHYNELAKTSPIALQDQGTMRALLRKRLMAGKNAIDPYEVAQMRDLEKTYAPAPNKPQGNAVA